MAKPSDLKQKYTVSRTRKIRTQLPLRKEVNALPRPAAWAVDGLFSSHRASPHVREELVDDYRDHEEDADGDIAVEGLNTRYREPVLEEGENEDAHRRVPYPALAARELAPPTTTAAMAKNSYWALKVV